MQAMDRINRLWGKGTLRSGAEGINNRWKMKRERMSPAFTTRWDQIPVGVAGQRLIGWGCCVKRF
jgi:DNA polymerase V